MWVRMSEFVNHTSSLVFLTFPIYMMPSALPGLPPRPLLGSGKGDPKGNLKASDFGLVLSHMKYRTTKIIARSAKVIAQGCA